MSLFSGNGSAKLKILLLTVILATILAIGALFLRTRRNPGAEGRWLGFPVMEKASISIDGFRQSAIREGITEWSMEAGSASLVETQAHVKDLKITFFLKNAENVVLTAEKGIIHTDRNDIEVTGNVVLQNGRFRMDTEQMRYRHEQRVILSEKPVKVTGEAFDLAAESMTYDLGSGKASLEGNVRGVIRGPVSL